MVAYGRPEPEGYVSSTFYTKGLRKGKKEGSGGGGKIEELIEDGHSLQIQLGAVPTHPLLSFILHSAVITCNPRLWAHV